MFPYVNQSRNHAVAGVDSSLGPASHGGLAGEK
jgi:hypothetical protein